MIIFVHCASENCAEPNASGVDNDGEPVDVDPETAERWLRVTHEYEQMATEIYFARIKAEEARRREQSEREETQGKEADNGH